MSAATYSGWSAVTRLNLAALQYSLGGVRPPAFPPSCQHPLYLNGLGPLNTTPEASQHARSIGVRRSGRRGSHAQPCTSISFLANIQPIFSHLTRHLIDDIDCMSPVSVRPCDDHGLCAATDRTRMRWPTTKTSPTASRGDRHDLHETTNTGLCAGRPVLCSHRRRQKPYSTF